MIYYINVLYIDDKIDEMLSKHMVSWSKTEYNYKGYSINKKYEEIKFDEKKEYDQLLTGTKISSANIILIDNRLYEERTTKGKFSGKQFKAIIKKLYPFIEVVIITQDKHTQENNIVLKYSEGDIDSDTYYKKNLDKYLNNAMQEIIDYVEIIEEIKTNSEIDKYIKDKISSSIAGENIYDELRKSDIDNLIAKFKEFKYELDKS